MSVKRWFAAITVVTAVGGLALWRWRASAPSRARDVIIVTVDTLRADRLGAYGWAAARTPRIDSLGRAGTVFTQATTSLPRTTPALASLFTGLWPRHHGSREVRQRVGPVPKLAEVLKFLGYATVAVNANSAVAGRGQDLHLGFDVFDEPMSDEDQRARAVTASAVEAVRALPRDQGLFLWVHYLDPHFPYAPPADWTGQPAGTSCRQLMEAHAEGRVSRGALYDDRDGIASRALADCQQLYDAEIAYTDEAVEALVDGLSRSGRFEGAIVVFTADHGENLGEDGLYYEHGPSLSDAAVRVPLVIVGGGPGGRRDRGVASLEDVMPTILALTGVPRGDWPKMDGRDLSARLLSSAPGPTEEARLAFAEAGSSLTLQSFRRLRSGFAEGRHCLNGPRYSLCEEAGQPARLYDHEADPRLTTDLCQRLPEECRRLGEASHRWPVEETRARAARGTRYKLVEHPRLEGGYSIRLFDLQADPAERFDVSELHPEVAAQLSSALRSWVGSSPPPARPARTPADLEAMRAIGYVQ